MAKSKISATVSPDLLEQARRLTGLSNVSELLDSALQTLISTELERAWLAAHPAEDLPGEVPVDLSGLPWEG